MPISKLISQLTESISLYDNLDFLEESYKNILILNNLVDKLTLKHNTLQLTLKSSLVKEQDFEKIFDSFIEDKMKNIRENIINKRYNKSDKCYSSTAKEVDVNE